MTQPVHPQSRPRRHPPGGRRAAHGFTIAEMAVVVVIMGVIMAASIRLLGTQMENAALRETREKQQAIKAALIGHLRHFKALPCPDDSFAAGVPPTGQAPAALCPTSYGVVPWLALGLPREAVLDGWGNFFVYHVVSGTGFLSNWTTPLAANAFNLLEYEAVPPALSAPPTQLVVQERDASGALQPITAAAVVVLVSHGKRDSGAIKQGGQVVPVNPGGSADEAANAIIDSMGALRPVTSFVKGSLALTGVNYSGAFDDVLTYMTAPDLLGPLIQDKTLLGGCKAYCNPIAASCTTTIPIPVGKTSLTCNP